MGRKTRQNKITSPELIAQINPKNIRLMNDFLEYLRSIGKADSERFVYFLRVGTPKCGQQVFPGD